MSREETRNQISAQSFFLKNKTKTKDIDYMMSHQLIRPRLPISVFVSCLVSVLKFCIAQEVVVADDEPEKNKKKFD